MRLVIGISALLGLAAGAACTKPNPRACSDGVCSDPDFPFCDIDGSLGGTRNECIAVACTPGEFVACRGDEALSCDPEGVNYETRECSTGCDARAGCLFELSNGLTSYLNQAGVLPDLNLENAQVDVTAGTIDGSSATPSWIIFDDTAAVALRVFVANRIKIGDIEVFATETHTTPSGGVVVPAIAFVAALSLEVTGTVSFRSDASLLPGAWLDEDCSGYDGAGSAGQSGPDVFFFVAGGGGGGNATAGAPGGSVLAVQSSGDLAGGMGGMPGGTDELVPLRGGCSAGNLRGGSGGPAIQLSSFGSIRVTGKIDARGQAGEWFTMPQLNLATLSGGGGGGSILLEAPTVELVSSSRLLAGGGPGGTRQDNAMYVEDGPALGSVCTLPQCGNSGNGASTGLAATSGATISYDNGMLTDQTGGGGGGGLGRVRVNAEQFGRASDALVNAELTTGAIAR